MSILFRSGILRLLIALHIICLVMWGQWEPESAHVNLYFPQLAFGGGPVQSWETTAVFHNSHTRVSASCGLSIFDDNGSPLALDLGAGPEFNHWFTVPPLGRTTLRPRVASPSIVTGWGRAECTLPVQGTILFRAIENGRPVVEISAAPVPPSHRFRSMANADLGIAVANLMLVEAQRVTVTAFDNSGRWVATGAKLLCGRCHSSFNLKDLLVGLPPGFEGSVVIEAEHPWATLIAWTLNADRGLLSSLPAGGLGWPTSPWERTLLTYSKLYNVVRLLYPYLDLSDFRLRVMANRVLNARALPNGIIEVDIGLAELISDSPGELAFVFAHVMAHQIQRKTSELRLRPDNVELDADALATLFLLFSGYDPYSGAGVFGKLMMASSRTGLLAPQFDDLADPYTSFSNRIGQLLPLLEAVCSLPEARDVCSEYQAFHPNLPASLPASLSRTPVPE